MASAVRTRSLTAEYNMTIYVAFGDPDFSFSVTWAEHYAANLEAKIGRFYTCTFLSGSIEWWSDCRAVIFHLHLLHRL